MALFKGPARLAEVCSPESVKFCSVSQLVRPDSQDSFLSRDWGRRVRYYAQSISGETDQIMTLESFELLLATLNRADEGWLHFARGGVGRLPREMMDSMGMIDIRKLHTAFASGETLYLTKVERLSPQLMRLARTVEVDLASTGIGLREPVSAHVFLTPPHSQGFAAHRDAHASFVLQLEGAKEWSVYEPPAEASASDSQGGLQPGPVNTAALEGYSKDTFLLEAGDVLYMPEWWPHEARASSLHSLHVTLRMFPLRWVDLFLGVCADHPALCGTLPSDLLHRPGTAREALLEQIGSAAFQERLPHLMEAFARRYSIPRTALPGNGFRQFLELDRIDLETRLIRPSGNPCHVFATRGEVCIGFPGGVIRGPGLIREVFEYVAAARELRPIDLPAVAEGEYDRLQVARTLVRDGLLLIAPTHL